MDVCVQTDPADPKRAISIIPQNTGQVTEGCSCTNSSGEMQITGPLMALMANAQRRVHMAELMRQKLPADGADIVAAWLMRAVG